jgi:octaprenyl-diphosphate synthase
MLAAELRKGSTPTSVASPKEPCRSWKHIIAPVEPFLQAVAGRLKEQIAAFESDIAAYAGYALTGQGKQLRPALVALSSGATGKADDSHVLAAVIIEMIHLATLVHDDVMDEAQIRRGRPTLAANWGNEISVLLGDCLFAHALKLAASYPTTEICRAVSSATNIVCSGEILQTQRRRDFKLSRAEYFKILQMKTGELFALSCDLGAYLSGAGTGERSALRRYGMAIGTAYQIYDDCLDLFGSEVEAGKSLGTDLAKGKLTLPVLLALERAPADGHARLVILLRHWEPDRIPELRSILEKLHVTEHCRSSVYALLETAREELAVLSPTESRSSLECLTDYVAHQTELLSPRRESRSHE